MYNMMARKGYEIREDNGIRKNSKGRWNETF